MRPVEIIHSIDRLNAAQGVQSNHSNDPFNATGALNIKHIKDEAIIENTTVPQTENQNKIDPDEEKKQKQGRRGKKKAQEQKAGEGNESGNVQNDPQKGNNLDIVA